MHLLRIALASGLTAAVAPLDAALITKPKPKRQEPDAERRKSGTMSMMTTARARSVVGTLLILTLLFAPATAAAQDKWFAADKAKHFGAGAGIAVGGYVIAVPLSRERRWRIFVGTTAGIGAAAGKELRDRRRGHSSWRDFAWSAAGTAAGVFTAWAVDRANN